MTRPSSYGEEFTAVAHGMNMIRASETYAESGDFRAYATFPNAARRDVGRPFEVTMRACAGPEDDRPACEGIDPDLFFPAHNDTDVIRMIRGICFRCPRRAACLEAGDDESYGVWGGQTTTERKRSRATRRRRSA